MMLQSQLACVTHVRTGPSGETTRQVKFCEVDVAKNQTGASLITAVTGKKIRVMGGRLYPNDAGAGADGTISFLSDTTAIAGDIPVDADVPGMNHIDLNGCPFGAFETAAGEALKVTTSANVGVDGYLAYIEV